MSKINPLSDTGHGFEGFLTPVFPAEMRVSEIGRHQKPSMVDRNTTVRPFAKPWRIIEHAESFEVQDSAHRVLAYVYFEDDPVRRDMMRRLSKYDARRMAEQILRLPELVAIERQFRGQA